MTEQKLHRGSATEFRRKATLGVAISGLVFLTPFAVNNFLHDRVELSIGSFVIVVVLALIAWTLRRGHYNVWLVFLGLVPTTIVFLTLSFYQQGIIGALWCFPAVPAFYFILPERHARLANLLLVCMAVPQAWLLLDSHIAARVTATLLITSIFSAIFVRVIISQQRQLAKIEEQRRDSMTSASHELRTPLALLVAKIQAMREGVRPLNQEQLTSLYLSVKHMSDLVDDLYTLTLADGSSLSFNKGLERLDEIVADAVTAAREKLAEHGLALKSTIEAPLLVNGDAKHLRQIIENLLGNCYRYATPGGTVSVTLRRKGKTAELTVSDSGPGVDDEALQHLFERFYRVDRSRSREKGGYGLGLSLVHALVEAHGGTVEAFHSEAGGLGIRINLPLLSERNLAEEG